MCSEMCFVQQTDALLEAGEACLPVPLCKYDRDDAMHAEIETLQCEAEARLA